MTRIEGQFAVLRSEDGDELYASRFRLPELSEPGLHVRVPLGEEGEADWDGMIVEEPGADG